ncbi:hypothetical protein BZG82_06845 [Salinivibrio sp. PR5]|uniref:hypothetical protein n=1 Tax=Salinivibrio sp. PR5 TaxID=1909484 RepID=UPI0009D579AC|nr:hypothetical protein [Salinivibrio sp. PR5]OOF10629.1 hypothetical protein BZG82_06845 [Salinivibrio sp. PR5]
MINKAESGQTIAVTGTAKGGDISEGDVVTMTINGTEYTTTVDGSGNWTVDVAGADLAADTEFEVIVSSTDDVGNTVESTGSSEHTVDTAAPGEGGDSSNSIAFDDADDLINESEQTSVTFSGTVEDGAAIDSIVISDGDANTADITVDANDISVDGDGNVTVIGQDVSSLADGELTVTMTVTDEAGNQGSVTDVVTLDTEYGEDGDDDGDGITPASVSITDSTADDNDDEITGDETATITVNFGEGVSSGSAQVVISDSDADNDATVTLDFTLNADGTLTYDGSTIEADAGGNYTITGVDVSGLSNGTVTANATFTDQDGNVETADDTVAKDTEYGEDGDDDGDTITAPSVLITDSTADDGDDEITGDETATITVNFGEGVSSGSAQVVISDSDADNDATVTLDVTLNADGHS